MTATQFYLYAFGEKGGPIKVGQSKHPAQRATEIKTSKRGRSLSGSNPEFHHAIAFDSVSSAKAAERAAHAALDRSRIRFHRSEWFSADLGTVADVMDGVAVKYGGCKVAPIPAALPRPIPLNMALGADVLHLVDEWRRIQPDIPPRAEAVRRLVLEGVERAGIKSKRTRKPRKDEQAE